MSKFQALGLVLAPMLTVVLVCSARQRGVPPTKASPGPSAYGAPGVTFEDVTSPAGLSGFRHISGSPSKEYLFETTGSGCAFLDYDNDDWPDIYLLNGSTIGASHGTTKAPHSALFHNNRNGTFTDVTDRAGVSNERWGQGVCIGDFDNDGWEDIYVTNFGPNRLYHNNHDGTFTDIAVKAGVTLGSWSSGSAFGDYNGDGLLDLFVAGYVAMDSGSLPPPASGASTGEAAKGRVGSGAAYAAGSNYCQYRNERVMCGPLGLKGAPDHLFRNNGDGTFTDVSLKAGVDDKAGYYGLGVAWFDYDDDGRLDLLVANDSTPNYLYRNRGDGTFEDVSYVSGLALNENGRAQAHMGIAIGDYNGDGRSDVFITNFADDSNVLYRNDGGGNFTDVSFASGLGEPSIPFLGWGTNFFDYDNDGLLDLIVANGHVYPIADVADWGTSYKQRLLLFRNTDGRFQQVGSEAGAALHVPRCSRGSAIADFDNDGTLDVLLNNIDEQPTLLRGNRSDRQSSRPNHWISLRLIGDPRQKCPRDAIGTTVTCVAGGKKMRGEVASGRSYYSQSDLRVHFGLGASGSIDNLSVRWSNGRAEQFEVKSIDRVLTIEQGKGVN